MLLLLRLCTFLRLRSTRISCGSCLTGASFHAGGGGASLKAFLTFAFLLPPLWLGEAELLDDELVALVDFLFSAVLGWSSSLSDSV